MRETTPSFPTTVLAAQYLRMSTEWQEYSMENQRAAIDEYAQRHGLAVVQTYSDAGKSGLVLRGQKGRRIVGNPYQIRLRESATGLFPELKQQRRTPHNGELAIEVITASMPEIRITHESNIHCVVFLNRGVPGPPRLLPFPKAIAQKWFEQVICYASEEIRNAHKASLSNLLTAEILELQYNDLDSAVDLLEAMIRHDGGALAKSAIDPARREHA